MKKLLFAMACTTALVAGTQSGAFAAAPNDHASLGLGFHSVTAPIGLRWWFSGQKVGLDLGLGFNSGPSDIDEDENVTGFAFEAGVPIVASSWQGVHLLFRPGILYQSQQIGFDEDPTTPGLQFDTENETTLSIMAELEAEVFLRDNMSVSASHGVAFRSFEPAFDGDNRSSFGTIGSNFSNIGFHVYFSSGPR